MAQPQRTLFDTDEPAWEVDDATEQCVATVVIPQRPIGPLDYTVPAELVERLAVGCRVRVPLGRGNRAATGYCVALEHRTAERRLKAIDEVVDARSLFSPAILELTRWMADYYLCPWGQVLDAVVPAGVRAEAGTRLTTFLHVPEEIAARRGELKLARKQAVAFDHLAASRQPLTPAELATAADCTQAPITALRRKGLVRSETRRVALEESPAATTEIEAPLELNPDQRAALDHILAALNAGEHETILVHGVTGSGKTEVYIQAIQEVVGFGRQAIVLVPEISLTPQTERRFRSRFGKVAVLHSHLSDVERHRQWQKIAAGEVAVVVGARSAVFAPTPQLGLIVIDEEHESSFRQESAPRYHAREVARQRARREGVPLVLGSATPSLESYARAQAQDDRLVEMPRRIYDRPLPAVVTVDLRTERHDRASRGAISRPLATAMETALREGGQVILLLNRRGFSTHIQCPACGFVLECPHCEIALTFHRQHRSALCHYCDYEQPTPHRCPECDYEGIEHFGRGTQRLEAEVQARFPKYAALRMDADTMQRPGSHAAALDRFRHGEVQILLGTQMIAKGLDFPNVTLVGVINADVAMHLPDFRAAERTFQLITQVAGRTGRGEKGGRVLVQTGHPDHPALVAAVRHDYLAFAAGELPLRKKLGYPPFAHMIRLVARGPLEAVTAAFAAELVNRLKEEDGRLAAGARIVGPAPAPLAKLRGEYRFAIQLQGVEAAALREVVAGATAEVAPPDDVHLVVDVDPLDML
ncbi:MAG: primosomal protein N' [Planctomycetota bacterium]|nr:MAG: primosomal protein N' [Planctomycetota bacterium]REK12605.1 MAG: primosomal protein N' [Planctomycetota bacterium]